MPPEQLVFLFAAGVAAGIVSVLVSLASIISYPALLAVGLPPVTANVTNTVALVLTGVGAAIGSQRELAGLRPMVLRLAVAAVAGGFTGAALLLVAPGARLRACRPGADRRGVAPAPRPAAPAGAVRRCGPAACDRAPSPRSRPRRSTSGYFGAAGGILSIAVLSTIIDRPLPRRERRQEHPRRVRQRGRRGRVRPAWARSSGPTWYRWHWGCSRAGWWDRRSPAGCLHRHCGSPWPHVGSRSPPCSPGGPTARGTEPVRPGGSRVSSPGGDRPRPPRATRPGVSTSAYIPNGTPRGLAISGR